MLRLFVALTLPADIRERVCGLMGGVPGARWVPAENLHLTLRFIGDVDEGAADDLDAALARTQFAPFMLTLEGVGVFGASRRPRALWVGVSPSAELDILQGRVEAAAQRAGQPAESRKFTPHVTLARLDGARLDGARLDGGGDRLGRFLENNALFRAGPFAVTGFSLMRSLLGRGDPLYDEVNRYGDDSVDGEDWTDDRESG